MRCLKLSFFERSGGSIGIGSKLNPFDLSKQQRRREAVFFSSQRSSGGGGMHLNQLNCFNGIDYVSPYN